MQAFRGEGRVSAVLLGDGTELRADAVVVGVGVRPNVALAEAAGLAVDNGVVVDQALRSSDPRIYAAGDIANAYHPLYGTHLRVEHWATALHSGPAAARSMLGAEVVYDRLPYFYTDQYDLGMEYTGHAPPGGYDTVVVRGDLAKREFIAFWTARRPGDGRHERQRLGRHTPDREPDPQQDAGRPRPARRPRHRPRRHHTHRRRAVRRRKEQQIMTSNPAAAIVVGVDGSPPSLHALDWAAREAVARHRPLRIVHAFRWPLTNELMGPPAVGPPDAGLQHAAETVLLAAADRARAAAPTLQVSTDLPADVPAAALIDASNGADLLVVGSRGLGGFTGLLLGSVGVQTAAHAACPVIVIRDIDSDDGGAGAGQVLVGVDDSDLSSLAVDFAFAHAALHGMGVVAVHAYQRTTVAPPVASSVPASDAQHEVRARMLTEAMAGYRDKYLDVPVQEKLVHGRPAAVLVAESAGAALTVVGSRGRGGFTGLLLGSTSQAVLHHASSPVAIIRAHPTRRGGANSTEARPNPPDKDDVTAVTAAAAPPAGTGPAAGPHSSPNSSTASTTTTTSGPTTVTG